MIPKYTRLSIVIFANKILRENNKKICGGLLMKNVIKRIFILALIVSIATFPVTVDAKTNSSDIAVSNGFTPEEKIKVEAIYKELFPNEYHYIKNSISISSTKSLKK
jgi:hypothetical protein